MDPPGLPRWGVMLPSFDPYRQGSFPLLPAARLAEQLGFDSGWVGDHLAYHPPTLDPACSLMAAATVTERIWLGTGRAAHVTDDPDRGWHEAAGLVAGQYGLPVDRLERWLHVGPAARVADAFTRYRDAGADGIVVVPMARDVLGQFEALAPLRAAVVA